MTVPIAGLDELWQLTQGDPRITVAVLDGPVDRSHSVFQESELREIEKPGQAVNESTSYHGTFIASLIFGQHQPGGQVLGIAPRCRGLIIPLFRDQPDGALGSCSQLDLAMAIARAAAAGANVINISAGEREEFAASPFLAETIAACTRQGILVVAAVGNDGRDCLHVPASLPEVLAIGGIDAEGFPLLSSNWGRSYRSHGLIAPGTGIIGAIPGERYGSRSGTSFATALVSGVAALLMSYSLQGGRPIDGDRLRDLLIETADGCPADDFSVECSRLLAGRLNLRRAIRVLQERFLAMNHDDGPHHDPGPTMTRPASVAVSIEPGIKTVPSGASKMSQRSTPSQSIAPSSCCNGSHACDCENCPSGSGLVFAQGRIGFDLVSEARRDSILQHMGGPSSNPADPGQMLAYLEANPWEATSILWTLNFDQTPIYAIVPRGPFAGEAYARLRGFLAEHHAGEIERISVAGVVSGRVTLLSGSAVPVIVPEIRGLASWTTRALAQAVAGSEPDDAASTASVEQYRRKMTGVRNLLDRVYHELRNFGLTPPDRALNYAATNALLVGEVFESAVKEECELDTIGVERSAICRTGADCWDVTMTFFFPERPWQTPRKSFRFTVDVSDVVPVMVGPIRSWSLR